MEQMAKKLLVKYDLGMSINCLYSIGDNMKKFSKNMLAHINVANKESTQTVEQKKSINTNKKGIMDLEKYGVIL